MSLTGFNLALLLLLLLLLFCGFVLSSTKKKGVFLALSKFVSETKQTNKNSKTKIIDYYNNYLFECITILVLPYHIIVLV